jgi:hypothetical protein
MKKAHPWQRSDGPGARASLIGRRFGQLQVIGMRTFEKGGVRWIAVCLQCGQTVERTRKALISGQARSCGRCFARPVPAITTPDPASALPTLSEHRTYPKALRNTL